MQTRQTRLMLRAALCFAVLASGVAGASAQTATSEVATEPSASRSAAQAQTCAPGVIAALTYNPAYQPLRAILAPERDGLRTLLDAVAGQTTYEALLTEARSIATAITNGRLLIALPDGTVVVDTAQIDDPTNAAETGNSYEHFQSKTVNENHNSRVAIFSAQLYPCGVGVESKLSTTTGQVESYVALRLGAHLNSSGTARLSVSQ